MPYARVDKGVWLKPGRVKVIPGSITHIVLPDDEDAAGVVVKVRSICGAVVAVKVDFGEWRTPKGAFVTVTSRPQDRARICKVCAKCKNEKAVAARMMMRGTE